MKPSWDDAPEWAKWVAQDANGKWYWHEYEPHPDEHGEWFNTGATRDVWSPSWRETKEPRP